MKSPNRSGAGGGTERDDGWRRAGAAFEHRESQYGVGGASMAIDTDPSQPLLQYNTVYKEEVSNGTQVRAGDGWWGAPQPLLTHGVCRRHVVCCQFEAPCSPAPPFLAFLPPGSSL